MLYNDDYKCQLLNQVFLWLLFALRRILNVR